MRRGSGVRQSWNRYQFAHPLRQPPSGPCAAHGGAIAFPQPVLAGAVFSPHAGKTGRPKSITAAAHKLARILFHMPTTGQAYDETVFALQEAQNHQRTQRKLRRQAKQFGFQLVASTAQ